VSTPIDLVSEAIDENLTEELTRLCGSEKKLVVGSAQHKAIIEEKLVSIILYAFLLLLSV
jgi:predicted ATPase